MSTGKIRLKFLEILSPGSNLTVDSDDIFEGMVMNLQMVFHIALGIAKEYSVYEKAGTMTTLVFSGNVVETFHIQTTEAPHSQPCR